MINATDGKKHTALFYAIKYRNGRAAVKLVEGGADFWTRAKEGEREEEVSVVLFLINAIHLFFI